MAQVRFSKTVDKRDRSVTILLHFCEQLVKQFLIGLEHSHEFMYLFQRRNTGDDLL